MQVLNNVLKNIRQNNRWPKTRMHPCSICRANNDKQHQNQAPRILRSQRTGRANDEQNAKDINHGAVPIRS